MAEKFKSPQKNLLEVSSNSDRVLEIDLNEDSSDLEKERPFLKVHQEDPVTPKTSRMYTIEELANLENTDFLSLDSVKLDGSPSPENKKDVDTSQLEWDRSMPFIDLLSHQQDCYEATPQNASTKLNELSQFFAPKEEDRITQSLKEELKSTYESLHQDNSEIKHLIKGLEDSMLNKEQLEHQLKETQKQLQVYKDKETQARQELEVANNKIHELEYKLFCEDQFKTYEKELKNIFTELQNIKKDNEDFNQSVLGTPKAEISKIEKQEFQDCSGISLFEKENPKKPSLDLRDSSFEQGSSKDTSISFEERVSSRFPVVKNFKLPENTELVKLKNKLKGLFQTKRKLLQKYEGIPQSSRSMASKKRRHQIQQDLSTNESQIAAIQTQIKALEKY